MGQGVRGPLGQNSLTWALSVLTGAEAWTLASNLILRSTENSLLTLPLGPSEASNTDTLDKLRQAVSEGQRGGRAWRLLLCRS